MTKQEYKLHILEFDNATNLRCEPIRKEIDEVGNKLDIANIEKERLSLELDAAKDRVTEVMVAMEDIESKYNKLKKDRASEMQTNGESQFDIEQMLNALNTACRNEKEVELQFLKAATAESARARKAYGLKKLEIREKVCKLNTLTNELKAIQREEWNKKHDWIVRHSDDVEDDNR